MHPYLRAVICAPFWLYLLCSATACAPPAPQLPVVNTFGARMQRGIFSHTVSIESQATEELSQVEVTCTVYCEREVFTLTRHWSYWKPAEVKTLDVSTTGGDVQRLVITGHARRGPQGQAIQLSAGFSWRHEPGS